MLAPDDIKSLGVGFSRKEIQLHKGMSGLKYYLVILYLRFHLEPTNIVRTSLIEINIECGYSSNSRNVTIYNDWRNIIHKLVSDGYITCSQDIMTVQPTKQFIIEFNYRKNPFYSNDGFVFINKYEYELITSYKTNMNKSAILGVFLFIKQYIINTEYSSGIAYPSKYQIAQGVGISSTTTIDKIINILVELNLLYVKSGFYIEDSMEYGSYIPASNIYSLSKDINIKKCLVELENKYGRPVYTKDTVPGTIKFLEKKKE